MVHPNPIRSSAIRPSWLDRHREPVLEPDLRIVDPHHHLWDRADERYLLDELLADINCGHTVKSTVFVQCYAMHRSSGPEALRPVGETEFVNGIAAMSASGNYGPTELCAGIVGHADLMQGAAVQEVLEAHLRAAESRFRGIRDAVAWDADARLRHPALKVAQGTMSDNRFKEGFARLAPLGLSFDAWVYHPQIDELMSLARAFPDTRIILDHVGGPVFTNAYAGRRDEVFAAWRRSIRQLASCPNVVVKVGGFGMGISDFKLHDGDQPPSSEHLAKLLRPFIETCIEAFTPSRCMFESNFPVDKQSYSYAVMWNAFKRLAAPYSAEEKTSLFSMTAERTYRIGAFA